MLEIKTDNSYLHCKLIPLLSFCCLLCFAYPIMVANNVFGRNGIFCWSFFFREMVGSTCQTFNQCHQLVNLCISDALFGSLHAWSTHKKFQSDNSWLIDNVARKIFDSLNWMDNCKNVLQDNENDVKVGYFCSL